MDSKPILKLNVHDYLWGYEDKLIRFASGVMPNFIDFIKFGLLDRVSNLINIVYNSIIIINNNKAI